MWWLRLSSSFVLSFLSSPPAPLVLNEVYYDHPGADGGWEFVEIHNGGAVAVDVGAWSLEVWDERALAWDIVWQGVPGDTIDAGGLFVIGGDAVTPTPSDVWPLALQNGPDALRLVADGVEADRLGYGVLDDASLYEGESAPDVPSGKSLGRYPDGVDTQNNAADFAVLEPSPGRLNRPQHNASVAPASPLRAATPLPGDDVIAVHVINNGVETIAPAALAVEVTDSASAPVPMLRLANDAAIAAGARWDVALPVTVGPGYRRLLVSAVFADDERPDDNTLVFIRRLGGVDIVVSEVMSDPPPGCPEYVEVFNAGATVMNLAGYRWHDRVASPALITADTLWLRPGAYLALTHDAVALRRWFAGAAEDAVVEIAGAWPSLNHSGSVFADSVTLLDAYAIAVDRVAYPPQPSDARGRSLERVDLFPGERPHTWVVSAGTPGAPNARVIERPVEVSLAVSPNPIDFSLGQPLLVTVSGDGAGGRARVQVFDINGRRVIDLGSANQLPFVYSWDGRDAEGHETAPGFYIVACELFSPDADIRGVERVVVGCARSKN